VRRARKRTRPSVSAAKSNAERGCLWAPKVATKSGGPVHDARAGYLDHTGISGPFKKRSEVVPPTAQLKDIHLLTRLTAVLRHGDSSTQSRMQLPEKRIWTEPSLQQAVDRRNWLYVLGQRTQTEQRTALRVQLSSPLELAALAHFRAGSYDVRNAQTSHAPSTAARVDCDVNQWTLNG
jgi:hypothetical protein